MMMKWYNYFFIICLILILSLSIILWLFEHEDKFIDPQLVLLIDKVNLSNGEYITKCYNGSYVIAKPTDFYICGSLNKNISLGLKQ